MQLLFFANKKAPVLPKDESIFSRYHLGFALPSPAAPLRVRIKPLRCNVRPRRSLLGARRALFGALLEDVFTGTYRAPLTIRLLSVRIRTGYFFLIIAFNY